MQRPFFVRRVGRSGIGDGDKKTREIGLPKNLPRADQLEITIGFNSVLRFPQPKQANPMSTHSPSILKEIN
jgi:hypothetical protein